MKCDLSFDQIILLLERATTKEELLLIKWKYYKYTAYMHKSVEFQEKFNKYFDMLALKEAKNNKKDIVLSLVKTYKINGDIYKEALNKAEEYNIGIYNILDLLNLLFKSKNFTSKELYIISNIKQEIEHKLIISRNLKEMDTDYVIAKTILNMFLSYGVIELKEFRSKTNCTTSAFDNALNILNNRNHPLYLQYIDIKEKKFKEKVAFRREIKEDAFQAERRKMIEKITSANGKEICDILSDINKYHNEYAIFCEVYDLNKFFLTKLIRRFPKTILELTSDLSNLKNVYNEYKARYLLLIDKVIEEINEAKLTGVPFDLYHYYLENSIPIEELEYIAKELKEQDKDIIQQYIMSNYKLLKGYGKKEIDIVRDRKILTCDNATINFTREELDNALEDIETNNLPLYKGVVYGAIKEQKSKTKRKA